ncbi:hypothetical protein JB92DRAFT_2837913 [Gautieria morchelliformis]|nr:hypothetical protein JB92DRAFT_2837913 [Gautieria morchelliformis]
MVVDGSMWTQLLVSRASDTGANVRDRDLVRSVELKIKSSTHSRINVSLSLAKMEDKEGPQRHRIDATCKHPLSQCGLESKASVISSPDVPKTLEKVRKLTATSTTHTKYDTSFHDLFLTLVPEVVLTGYDGRIEADRSTSVSELEACKCPP